MMRHYRWIVLCLSALLLCGCGGDLSSVQESTAVDEVQPADGVSVRMYPQTMNLEEIYDRKLDREHVFIKQAAKLGTVEDFSWSAEDRLHIYELRAKDISLRLTVDGGTTRMMSSQPKVSGSVGSDLRHFLEPDTGYMYLANEQGGVYYWYENGELIALEWFSDYAWYRLEGVSVPLSAYSNEGDLVSALLCYETAMAAKATCFPTYCKDDLMLNDCRVTAVYSDSLPLDQADNADLPPLNGRVRCPVVRIGSTEELIAFAETYREQLDQNGYVGATNWICAAYDDEFFEIYDLLLVKIRNGSISLIHGLDHVSIEDDCVTVHVSVRASLSPYVQWEVGGWILNVPVRKDDIADCTMVDATFG